MGNIPWRRILTILIFLAATFLIAWLLYLAFLRPETVSPDNQNGATNGQLPNVNGNINRAVTNGNTSGGLPAGSQKPEPPSLVANGGKTITKTLVDTASRHLALAGNTSGLIYYDPLTGKFYQVTKEGADRQVLNDETFKGVADVAWAPSRQKAVLTFLDGANLLYDFQSGDKLTLPSELSEFSFSPDSTKLAAKFIGSVPGDNWLTIVNTDGSGAQAIESLGEKVGQVQVNWSPNSQIVATYQEGLDGERQQIVPLGANNENFKAIETEGRGFVGQWDRTGSRLLYSVHSSLTSFNPELYIVRSEGDSIGQGNIRLGVSTWADKCAFGADTIDLYCAVPAGLEPGSGLYPELANDTPYQFYKINLTTGAQQMIADPTDPTGTAQYSVDDVFLDGTGDLIYFSDPSGRIHTIKIR